MMTMAHKIADILGDGQTWAWPVSDLAARGLAVTADTDDRATLGHICREHGATHERGHPADVTVYHFDDGSAIVAAGGGWDVRADGCAAHCWDGAGCTCHDDDGC